MHDDSMAGLRQHNRRGGYSRGARFAHVVDGQLVTTRQIAARLGIGETAALQRTKRRPHPLTWASLSERIKAGPKPKAHVA